MRDRYVNGYLAQQPSIATVHLPGNAEHKEIPVQRFTLITRLYLKVLQSLLEQVSLMVLSDSISDCTTTTYSLSGASVLLDNSAPSS